MSIADLRSEMEAELSERVSEVRALLELSAGQDERIARTLRRATVVMLYAHYEGFAKFCFAIYIRFLGQHQLECNDVVAELIATSWSPIFSGLSQPSKNKYFKRLMPDDTRLHSFCRQVEFIERVNEAGKIPVRITEDAVDLESNLSSSVFRKNLYILGLDRTFVDTFESHIAKLVRWRHNIAHGGDRYEVSEEKLKELYEAVSELMDAFMVHLTSAMKSEIFRRDVAV